MDAYKVEPGKTDYPNFQYLKAKPIAPPVAEKPAAVPVGGFPLKGQKRTYP